MNEWNAFKHNLPSGVTLGSCGGGGGGGGCARITTFKTYPGAHNCPGSGFGDVANCLAAPWPVGYGGCPGTKNCLCTNWVAGGNIWSTLDMCCC